MLIRRTIGFVLVFTSLIAVGQTAETDSIDVRVFNKGKYHLKEYVLTVDGKDYNFFDLSKNQYSSYKRLPYIWTSNKSKTTVIVKKIIKYDIWMTKSTYPIDHIGEKKLNKGSYTIELETKNRKEDLHLKENIVKDK